MKQKITELAKKHLDQAIALRRELHLYPETAFEEVETSKRVRAFLDAHHIPYVSGIAKTGILATIKGKHPGKTVLLRGDMDALDIEEDPNNNIVSLIKGKMHACGHDGHTSGLALAGAILNELKDDLSGTIKLMFQPAEEFSGGAKPMIDAGILNGVDAAFGAHLWGSLVENKAYVKAGSMMAAPDGFKLKVIGKGGHGAMPHGVIDPIVISAHIITAIQTIVSRSIDPLDSVVISIGQINGGSAHNIIPNEVEMVGTIRTLTQADRDFVPKKMQELAKGIATSFGGDALFTYEPAYPILINDDAMTRIAKKALSDILGVENVYELERPIMGGEDFAYVAQAIPSSFFYLGIAKDENSTVMHHHPSFQWDDKNLLPLGSALAYVAYEFLHNN